MVLKKGDRLDLVVLAVDTCFCFLGYFIASYCIISNVSWPFMHILWCKRIVLSYSFSTPVLLNKFTKETKAAVQNKKEILPRNKCLKEIIVSGLECVRNKQAVDHGKLMKYMQELLRLSAFRILIKDSGILFALLRPLSIIRFYIKPCVHVVDNVLQLNYH